MKCDDIITCRVKVSIDNNKIDFIQYDEQTDIPNCDIGSYDLFSNNQYIFDPLNKVYFIKLYLQRRYKNLQIKIEMCVIFQEKSINNF